MSTNPLENLGAAMIEGVLPGIVQVRSSGRGPRRGRRSGAGAGFLWSPDGSVMTNNHVVAGSRGRAEVVLADDRSFVAEVLGSSRRLDLAMLRLRDAPIPEPAGGQNPTDRLSDIWPIGAQCRGRCLPAGAG